MDIVKVKVTKGKFKDLMLLGRVTEYGSFVVYGCETEDTEKFIKTMQNIIEEELGWQLDISEVEEILNATDMTFMVSYGEYETIKE